MILKKFSIFQKKQNFNSIGGYIEKLIGSNERLLKIASDYINISNNMINEVDTLDHFGANQLLDSILEFKNEEINKTQDIVGGRNIFKSFLKLITSLGLKEVKINWDKCPKKYLFYIQYENIDSIILKSIINNRFKSLEHLSNKLDYTKNECHLYYGLTLDMNFEYGIISESEKNLGSFKFTKSNFNWLLVLDSLSFLNFKKDLIHFTYEHIILFINGFITALRSLGPSVHIPHMPKHSYR